MKGAAIIYTAEELAWIEAHHTLPRRELAIQFIARFARPDISQANLTSLCKRKGWLTGRTGQYVKGQEPPNKGQKMPYNENSARTRFKKGNRTGRANHVWKPIGTERLSKEGYREIKMHDGMPLQSRWRGLHLVNWEAQNGPIPEGHCLKCLDGDKTNCDPVNWKLIPRAMLPRLSGRWTLGYDEASPELKPTVMAVAELDHKARAMKRNAK